jgi:hypothetical protein
MITSIGLENKARNPDPVKVVSIFILLISQTWDRIRQHHEDKETWPVSEDGLGFSQKHTKFV